MNRKSTNVTSTTDSHMWTCKPAHCSVEYNKSILTPSNKNT